MYYRSLQGIEKSSSFQLLSYFGPIFLDDLHGLRFSGAKTWLKNGVFFETTFFGYRLLQLARGHPDSDAESIQRCHEAHGFLGTSVKKSVERNTPHFLKKDMKVLTSL